MEPSPLQPELSAEQLRRLFQVSRQLVSEHDLERLLGQVLDAARDLTGARFAALGVLDDSRRELERFLTLGMDAEARKRIGALPHGRGILGELIRHPEPLRIAQIGSHPRSFGFPPGHPPMTSFLGVPIVIRGEAYGNLYLADTQSAAEFSETDELVAVALAESVAVAIDNARLYERLERRRDELEHAVDGLSANVELARAVEGEMDPERVLELIAKRGRALVEARTFLVLLPRGDELTVAEAAGERAEELRGRSVPISGSLAGEVLHDGRSERLADLSARMRLGLGDLGGEARSGLLAPLSFRDRPRGVLVAFDRLEGGTEFDADHELLLRSFSASAGVALTRAEMVEAEMLHRSIESTELERRRWARELHDETLQELGALKLVIEMAQKQATPEGAATLDAALAQIRRGIENLHGLITDLRPAALDELGVGPALDALVERVSATSGLRVSSDIHLGHSSGRESTRLDPQLEGTVYRLVQESLTNVVKHAEASEARVRVAEADGWLEVEVADEGHGFDPKRGDRGFGLIGMRERVALANGRLVVDSRPGSGTTVRARLPIVRAPAAASAAAGTGTG